MRPTTRRLNGLTYDDNAGGETHPMAYVDDTDANVPHQDVLFFLQEFQCLVTPLGCHLNPTKMRIMTSTYGASSLPAIKRDYGYAVADSVRQALATYSVSSSIAVDGTTACCPLKSLTACATLDSLLAHAHMHCPFLTPN